VQADPLRKLKLKKLKIQRLKKSRELRKRRNLGKLKKLRKRRNQLGLPQRGTAWLHEVGESSEAHENMRKTYGPQASIVVFPG